MDRAKSYIFRIVRDSRGSADSGEHKIESTKIGILEGTTLKDIPAGTTVGELKKALTVSAGANLRILDKEREVITDDTIVVTEEMEILVESGTQTDYKITIKA
ncbi:hypothetical protein K144313037_02980 [Clostridium tetani]|uniref:Ubiquitin-like domain-containing protein n=1 Tax=Clostridium tetani TaxID=1513 RepID=A0ABC8EAY7_CLOTA|nr:S-layer protein [Clostridium tetani]BDR66074.1 hypothetical protein K144312032_03020 [Clostridium tetani]BDR68886.1 hypothetical protein K144313037_02980 [Clostridium tetani]BDR77364.1 hypothetical protein K154307017_02970 [Clostridium tetani]BDR80060.1 hypothetical protein K234311028_03060 [Clostridium tetani]